jgi:hypothetical protein
MQQQQVQVIVEQVNTEIQEQNRARFEQMRTAFQARGGPGGPGGFPGAPGGGGRTGRNGNEAQTQAKTKAVPAGNEEEPDRPAGPGQDSNGRQRPQFDRDAFATEMQKAGEEQDKVYKAAETRIAKVLTAKQRQNFNKLLGESFDVSKLADIAQFGGRGGRGGQGGGRGGRGGPPTSID